MRWSGSGRARAQRTVTGQLARRAAANCSERRLCSAYRLRAGTGREKEKRNGVSLVTWLRRLSGEGFTGAATRGIAGAQCRHEHRSNRSSLPVGPVSN